MIDKKTLITLIENGLSQEKIADKLDCSSGAVRYWLDKYNLKTKPKREKNYSCSCGEKNPKNFYGQKRYICKKCQIAYNKKVRNEKRDFIISLLGGKCIKCGYDKYPCSMDVHHKDPSKKDPNFNTMRFWSRERIIKELENCELMCRNCHAAYHCGYID